jgi:hypothetical protein
MIRYKITHGQAARPSGQASQAKRPGLSQVHMYIRLLWPADVGNDELQ